ncbi:conserved membrane hypothetical protein [Pseudomonas sp. 8Z]|uniref:DUF6338 family protein n=1 Tax=Pseudomonas sp. 8Z TaxID=2653166 RepID=UPI0012F41125|nr:DUF6338 family protein [Pseudomonas sp. 8Z]VXC94792.1 conserved membrane hypothetical protein [Pseudomonas sp. 8Z]
MDIWEIDKLFLFIAFVIPGFISLKFYQLLYPGVLRNASDQLVDAVAYSCVNYALLLWLILIVESSSLQVVHQNFYYLFYAFVLFVAPIIWVLLWSWLRTRELFQKNAPHPVAKPWDFVFQQRKQYWVIVYLKSGEQIGGKFSTKSFASSAPADEQIYLEEVWLVENGVLQRAVKESAGVLIGASEISHIEFLNYHG